MKSKKTIILLFGVLLIGISTFYAYRFFTSPKYSLYKIHQSYKEKNKELFLQYVDLDSIINNLIDQILNEEKKRLNSSSPLENFAILLTIKLIEEYRTPFKQFLKNFILSHFDETFSVPTLQDEVKSIFSKTLSWWINFKDIRIHFLTNEVIYLDENTAIVSVDISSPKTDPPIKLSLKFIKINSHWKLIEIQNLYKYFY